MFVSIALGVFVGKGVAALCGLFGIGLLIHAQFSRKHKEEEPKVSSGDWKDLAARFDKIPASYVDAEFYSETLDNDGKPVGEHWRFGDPWEKHFASECEALCGIAGAMLMKSPKISTSLSEKVKTRSHDASRWLYYLAEVKGPIKIRTVHSTFAHGFKKDSFVKVIEQLPHVCAVVCLECAAKEI